LREALWECDASPHRFNFVSLNIPNLLKHL
jgi:hypothetical protein